jgi:hypothetical protein
MSRKSSNGITLRQSASASEVAYKTLAVYASLVCKGTIFLPVAHTM